ncbi:MAG: ABC transporter substrate-binding protein [Chloroflexota bacterium]
MKPKWMPTALLIVVLSLIVTACGGTPQSATSGGAATGAKDKVTLQLKWVVQSQFAGYYAAKEKGFYDAENLDVTIQPGGPDIIPEQVVAGGSAQFGLDWLPSLLSAREQGTPLVNIAQVFQYSGMREIFWKDSGMTGVADFKGKKIAVWLGGNEFELLATLNKYGLDKDKDLTIVQQPFDMNLLLNREVDAAAAMTYNEYAQVLETTNPKTGQLYKPEDLVVIDFNKEGTAMLEDGIFTTEAFLQNAKNQDIAVRFLRASFRGWIYCRDNWQECVEIVLKQGPTLGRGHMTWQMNEINKLIWPSPNGIGVMDPKLYQQTVDIALKFGVIKNPPSANAYTDKYAREALQGITEDTKGLNWQPAVVEVTPGGK